MSFDPKFSGQDGDRLNGWKEIAAYLGKDVRTAHRWSKHEGMPVYRHAGSKRGAVYAYRSEIDAWIHADRSPPPKPGRNTMLAGIAATLALGAIVTAAIFWPGATPENDQEAAQAPTWVLIGNIENRSGEEGIDETVYPALRKELLINPGFQVMSPDLVGATLALMKHSADTPIDRVTGRQVCIRNGDLCMLLAGRVDNFDSNYLFRLEIIDPRTGQSVGFTEESATGRTELVPAVERLARWLGKGLKEGRDRLSEPGEPLEKVTTSSLRALELFSRGMQVLHESRHEEAEALFRQATHEDPEFATALVFIYWTLYHQRKGSSEEAMDALEKAMALADSASEPERYFIEGTYSDMIEREQESACRSYRKLAELFPGHYFAAVNAVHVCGVRLGYREDAIRWSESAAIHTGRIDARTRAARTLSFLARDFDRARPHVEWLSARVESGDAPEWVRLVTETFRAEELLALGKLQEASLELDRIESGLDELNGDLRSAMARNLATYNLSLGRLRKAEALGKESHLPGVIPAWLAYLRGDRAAFDEHMRAFLSWLEEAIPDADARRTWSLGWNMTDYHGYPVDVLFPLYDAGKAMGLPSGADSEAPVFLSLPKFRAKIQLAQGRTLLDQGLAEDATDLLRQGTNWFRENGVSDTLPYYFLGAELLALALSEMGDDPAAYEVLSKASANTMLVNSSTLPLSYRILARQASLARQQERPEEARRIESRLEIMLALADPDHPILVQIQEWRKRAPID